jgi:hypothetical protein
MPSTILSERDTNVKQPVPSAEQQKDSISKPKSMEYHRQVLESRLKEGKSVTAPTPAPETLSFFSAKVTTVPGYTLNKQLLHSNQQTYVSPSDTIMSPATQKLAAFKNKHIKA